MSTGLNHDPILEDKTFCHKCGIEADRTCLGCEKPLCFLCDLDDTDTCNQRCEKRACEPDLFTQNDMEQA